MQVPREEIERQRTPNGGFTRATLAQWGIGWPPEKGFIAKLTGEQPVPKISSALRYAVLKRDGGRCVLCGRNAHDGVKITVDHIFPKSVHRDLPVTIDSLQTMCYPCNEGKSNRDATDWRKA